MAVKIVELDIQLDTFTSEHANMVRDMRSSPAGTGLVIGAMKTIKDLEDKNEASDAAKDARKGYNEK